MASLSSVTCLLCRSNVYRVFPRSALIQAPRFIGHKTKEGFSPSQFAYVKKTLNEGDDPQNQTSLKDIERLTILEEEHQMWIPGGEHYNRMSKVVDDFLEKQASEGK